VRKREVRQFSRRGCLKGKARPPFIEWNFGGVWGGGASDGAIPFLSKRSQGSGLQESMRYQGTRGEDVTVRKSDKARKGGENAKVKLFGGEHCLGETEMREKSLMDTESIV